MELGLDSVLEKHCEEFADEIKSSVPKITQASISLYYTIIEKLPRTPVKFHYIFNLRDLSNIFQGILFSTRECLNNGTKMARLYMHEARRVYCDKLTEKKDQETFDAIMQNVCAKEFEEMDKEELFAVPNNFCHFAKVSFTNDNNSNLPFGRSLFTNSSNFQTG